MAMSRHQSLSFLDRSFPKAIHAEGDVAAPNKKVPL